MSSSGIDDGNDINLVGLASIHTSDSEATNNITGLGSTSSSELSSGNSQGLLEDLVLLSSEQRREE